MTCNKSMNGRAKAADNKIVCPTIATVLCMILTMSAAPRRNFAREMVAQHNEVRAEVRMPPLAWSERLAAHAQQWADYLIARGQFDHSRNSHYGENLFEIRGAMATPEEVVRSWASESRYYDYRSNGCRDVCGHYTQLVWRDTKEVGCAVAARGNREVWVCNYDPPGNYIGQRPW